MRVANAQKLTERAEEEGARESASASSDGILGTESYPVTNATAVQTRRSAFSEQWMKTMNTHVYTERMV